MYSFDTFKFCRLLIVFSCAFTFATFGNEQQMQSKDIVCEFLQTQKDFSFSFSGPIEPYFSKQTFCHITDVCGEDCLKMLHVAEQLYTDTLYSQAISCYKEFLKNIQRYRLSFTFETYGDIQAFVFCRLGQAYFFCENHEKSLKKLLKSQQAALAISNAHIQHLIQQNSYLIAVIHRKNKAFDKAISELESYFFSSEKKFALFEEEAEYELGLNYFFLGDYKTSRHHFEKISKNTRKKDLFLLAQLYHYRALLKEKLFCAAEKKEELLAFSIPKDHFLHKEFSYVCAEQAFYAEEYDKAIALLKPAISEESEIAPVWYFDHLHLLGWSYIKLADNEKITKQEQQKYFSQAVHYFKMLIKYFDDERSYLDLAQCYLIQNERLEDQKAWFDADEILFNKKKITSKQGKAKSFLLRAEAALTYAEREAFYSQLMQKEYSDVCDIYARGCFSRALNDFKQACTLQQNKEKETSITELYAKSSQGFQKAFELLYSIDKSLAATSLEYLAKVCLHQDSKDSLLYAFSTLSKVLSTDKSVSFCEESFCKIQYFHAYFAAKIAFENGSESECQIAENLLCTFIASSKNSHFIPESLILLGTLYVQMNRIEDAEKVYFKIIDDYPNCEKITQALYWGAYCCEKLNKSRLIVKSLRKRIFEDYATSSLAPQAYFQYFSLRDYLQGDAEPLKHLQKFKVLFPNSPLLIQSFYLIGLDYKRDRKSKGGKSLRKAKLIEAIAAFSESEKAFERFFHLGSIPIKEMHSYATIRCRAILEKGLANQMIAERSEGAKHDIFFQYAEDAFNKMYVDFEENSKPYIRVLFEKENFPLVYEETLYAFLKCYVSSQNYKEAMKIVDIALKKYEREEKIQGYYLCKFYIEKGLIAIEQKNWQEALESFIAAEESDNDKYLSVDERLNLWIQQSYCHKFLNEIDKAMVILSKIINHRAVSALRIKAMYLRAEMYQLQGRHELAKKQLEATALKGGKWAEKAKQTLNKEYILN